MLLQPVESIPRVLPFDVLGLRFEDTRYVIGDASRVDEAFTFLRTLIELERPGVKLLCDQIPDERGLDLGTADDSVADPRLGWMFLTATEIRSGKHRGSFSVFNARTIQRTRNALEMSACPVPGIWQSRNPRALDVVACRAALAYGLDVPLPLAGGRSLDFSEWRFPQSRTHRWPAVGSPDPLARTLDDIAVRHVATLDADRSPVRIRRR